ncbi:MAG: adenylate/guanylate cyclase domain-containing protein [Alphaproteobacteria bacterium]|nr:adenylate/guanylate cyclase domain-containing protein [Alphaproteobacteria bacterium]
MLDALLAIADDPSDGEVTRHTKRTQVAMTWVSLPAILVMMVAEAAVHGVRALPSPLAYELVSLGMLAWLARDARRYATFRWLHPLVVFLLPWVLQEWVGGFVASGGVGLWGICGVASVPLFVEPRWFGRAGLVYAAVAIASVAAEAVRVPTRTASDAAIGALFALNTLGITAFLFASVGTWVELLAAERARSEQLLLNILPQRMARRLKADRSIIAEQHPDVTVLFADLVGFTVLASSIGPEELVAELDRIFSAFDVEVEARGLEKIKTIGDAYMVAAGVQEDLPDHADRAVDLGLTMLERLRELRPDGALRMRIGIHSGPVVAGVIGRARFAYDLWGDTVNTASRMESHGLGDRVQISDAVRERLRRDWALEDRGSIEVKGKGPMRVWLVGRPG